MKTILVFDDEVLDSFKSFSEPKIVQSSDNWWLRWNMMYGMKVLDCTKKEKRFIRYMFNKKRRVQKKWDKKYNDKFKEVSYNPMMGWLAV